MKIAVIALVGSLAMLGQSAPPDPAAILSATREALGGKKKRDFARLMLGPIMISWTSPAQENRLYSKIDAKKFQP